MREIFLDTYINALHDMLALFGANKIPYDPTTEDRLRVEICAQYEIFNREFPDEFDDHLYEPSYRWAC